MWIVKWAYFVHYIPPPLTPPPREEGNKTIKHIFNHAPFLLWRKGWGWRNGKR
jgi:hypothetical protein